MAPINLKLKVVLDTKDLSGLPDAVKKANEKASSDSKKAADREDNEAKRRARQRAAIQRASIDLEERQEKQRTDALDRATRQRIAMQRASVAVEENLEKQRAAVTRARIAAASRLEREAAVAEASLVLDRFDRRIAIEKVKHTQMLRALEGNHAAIEAETRRHQAVVGRIQMDKANFPNTPFQQMLGSFTKLNQGLGKVLPAMTTVSTAAGAMGGTMGVATGAVGAFGGALTSLTMGPVGLAIAAITALSAGVNALIDSADRAADARAGMGATVRDPAKVKELLEIRERFDRARANIGKVKLSGMGASIDPAVQEMQRASDDWKKIAGVRLEEETIWTAERLKRQGVAAAKTTDAAKDALKKAKEAQQERWDWEREVRDAERNNAEKHAKWVEDSSRKYFERELKIKEDEDKTRRIYAKREADAKKVMRDSAIGSMPEGEARRISESKARQQDEIAAFNLSEEAKTMGFMQAEIVRNQITSKYEAERTQIQKEESDKRKQIQQEESQARLQATSQFFSGFAALAAQANMKDRAARLRWKALAIAEATANTSLAATKALSAAPPPFNFLLMAGTIAAGLAQVNQIKEQRFARGTSFAPGGMALVGEEGPEMVFLPRGSQVKTAGETKRMMGPQSITINIHPAPGTTPAQARELGAAAHDGYVARLKEWKQMESDAAEWGVVAA